MSVIIKRVWNQNKMVNIESLHGMAFQAEDGGHVFEISGVNDAGEAVPLSGTVAGVFMRPDRADIALIGAASGGVASVTLTDDCYAVPGRFGLTIFVTEDGKKTAVYAAIGTVSRTSGGGVAGDTPQDVVDLINAIEAAVATIPADYTGLIAAVAPTYSSSSVYAAGAYAWYNGVLYRCTTAITTAESWTAAHWASTYVSNELTRDNSQMSDIYLNTVNNALLGFGENKYTYELGGISSSTGFDNVNNTRIRMIGMFFATKGTVISHPSEDRLIYVMLYDMDGSYSGSSGGWVQSYTVTQNHMVRIVARKSASNPTISVSDIPTIVAGIDIAYAPMHPLALSRAFTPSATNDPFDANNVTVGMVALTDSAVIEAALNLPTKSAGLLFAIQTNAENRCYQFYLTNTVNQRIWVRYRGGDQWMAWTLLNTSLNDSITLGYESFDWELGYTISGAGTYWANATFACTKPRPVKQFDIFTNNNDGYGQSGKTVDTLIAAYDGDTFVERVALAYRENYIVPSGVDNIRFVFGYPSSVTDPPDMTAAQLKEYFSVKVYGDTMPYVSHSDGEYPVYVAIGASTTSGAVHHKNGTVTRSPNNYPDYIGNVLNLETHNLGVGTTGFLARNGADNNFCDQILNNGTILAKAKLVTLMFGYGNDANAGLPIGEYDDYYPYDDSNYRTSGTTATAYQEMVNKGATLFGLLNWCIKYINETYPFAQLVVIFGSPATSDIRTVTATAQTGSSGVAPYKLTFFDPYSPGSTATNRQIKQIDTEIKKLRDALDIPIVNLFFEGNCFDYYSCYAKDPDDSTSYALFSTTLSGGTPTFNRHPNDRGYLYFSRFLAGKVISVMKH